MEREVRVFMKKTMTGFSKYIFMMVFVFTALLVNGMQVHAAYTEINVDSKAHGTLKDSMEIDTYYFEPARDMDVTITIKNTGRTKPSEWEVVISDQLSSGKVFNISGNYGSYTTEAYTIGSDRRWYVKVQAYGQFSTLSYDVIVNSSSSNADTGKSFEAVVLEGANPLKETTYQILRDSKKMKACDKLIIKCPTDGYLDLKTDAEGYDNLFGLDEEVNTGNWDYVENFSGTILAGTHCLYHCSGNMYSERTVSYTFYPYCNVYYVDGGKVVKRLKEYQLSESSERWELPTSEDVGEGYQFDGWYEDASFTKSIDYIDESIGKDWYLYPKKTAIRYDVKYILNGGENAEENPDSYTVEDGVISLQDPKKDGYSFQGWYTLENGKKSYYKKIGEYRLKSLTLYADWKKIPDNPGMTSLVKLTVGKEKMRVRWKKIRTDVTGYILEYSTSKNFENATSVTIKGWNNNMKIIKGLSSGDKYYVRVRTYSTFDGNTYYSEWAKPKKVKIK